MTLWGSDFRDWVFPGLEDEKGGAGVKWPEGSQNVGFGVIAPGFAAGVGLEYPFQQWVRKPAMFRKDNVLCHSVTALWVCVFVYLFLFG